MGKNLRKGITFSIISERLVLAVCPMALIVNTWAVGMVGWQWVGDDSEQGDVVIAGQCVKDELRCYSAVA